MILWGEDSKDSRLWNYRSCTLTFKQLLKREKLFAPYHTYIPEGGQEPSFLLPLGHHASLQPPPLWSPESHRRLTYGNCSLTHICWPDTLDHQTHSWGLTTCNHANFAWALTEHEDRTKRELQSKEEGGSRARMGKEEAQRGVCDSGWENARETNWAGKKEEE